MSNLTRILQLPLQTVGSIEFKESFKKAMMMIDSLLGGGSQVAEEVTASRNLDLDDVGRYIPVNDDAEVILTIRNQDTVEWDDNVEMAFEQVGAGKVTIAAGAGVTLRVLTGFNPSTAGQGGTIAVKRVAENVFTVAGALESAA